MLRCRIEQSWGDDLESLGYIFCYFARGSLPWQGTKAETKKEKNEMIRVAKENMGGEDLCYKILPDEFATYIDYTRALGFEDKPDYAYLRRLFRGLFKSRGFKYDNVFDWTERRFHEVHGHPLAPPAPLVSSKKRRVPRPPPATLARRGAVHGRRRGKG